MRYNGPGYGSRLLFNIHGYRLVMGFLWHVISEAIFTTLINKCDKILPSTCFCNLQSVLESGRRCVPAVILSPGVFGLDEKLGLKIQYCHVQGWFARPGCRLLMMFHVMHLLSVNSKIELTLSVSVFLKGNDKIFALGWMFRFRFLFIFSYTAK